MGHPALPRDDQPEDVFLPFILVLLGLLLWCLLLGDVACGGPAISDSDGFSCYVLLPGHVAAVGSTDNLQAVF